MKNKNLYLLLIFSIMLIAVGTNCKGPQGPAGQAGQQGTQGPGGLPGTPGLPSGMFIIDVNSTWLKTSTPYSFTTSVYIANGVTLTVDPGVVAQFYPGTGIYADGTINIMGTQLSPVTFTDATSLGWDGIVIGGSLNTPDSTATYLSMTGAGIKSNAAIMQLSNSYIDARATGSSAANFIGSALWYANGIPRSVNIYQCTLIAPSSAQAALPYAINVSAFDNTIFTGFSISHSTLFGSINFDIHTPVISGINIVNNQIYGGIQTSGEVNTNILSFTISANNLDGVHGEYANGVNINQPIQLSGVFNPYIGVNNITNYQWEGVTGGGIMYGNYLAGDNGASIGTADTTTGGPCNNVMDTTSPSSPWQYSSVDCVQTASSSPVSGTGP